MVQSLNISSILGAGFQSTKSSIAGSSTLESDIAGLKSTPSNAKAVVAEILSDTTLTESDSDSSSDSDFTNMLVNVKVNSNDSVTLATKLAAIRAYATNI